jgi:hypothetical protein
VLQFWIQGRPPGPKGFYVRVMLPDRYRPIAAYKMTRIIMSSASRVSAVLSNFLLPGGTKLRTTITTSKITHVIKIDFNIARNNIIVPFRTYDLSKVFSCPRFS